MSDEFTSQVIPFERKKNGILIDVDLYFQDANGNRVNYRAEIWVRKNIITEVCPAHPTQPYRTVIFLSVGKTINTYTDTAKILAHLERGEA